ncbi:hypothetical protein Dsin_014061 [Dipteronia sinensis]|uniref:R13L1/DRL21-like LRR repeat region domain-containing protein n=1 Tax=Dipteronia sinensis TaxID=43782 RepID=A0AAE0AL10_9ROSI|nr:hypothetical protein Dsin_014061 [Dipteronia sinensis]
MNYRTSFSYTPKGFERLTCLRTLWEFVVSGDGFGSSKVCSTLASFENLNHLGGYLSISGLGYVVDFVEAKKAELKRKKNLPHLELFFNSNKEIEGRTNEDDKFLLEVLQPPSNLEELKIAQYGGNTVSPSWLIPLSKLRRLTLSYCENCEHLPPLGRLSSLEYLSLNNMSSLKRVGDEFLGIESEVASSSSSFIIAFPKLKSLKFESLDEWEEWDTTRREGEDVTLMPCLRSLTIDFCILLKLILIVIFWISELLQLEFPGEADIEVVENVHPLVHHAAIDKRSRSSSSIWALNLRIDVIIESCLLMK